MPGIPVVIVESGGMPVNPVEANYPVMTVADNDKGLPITISTLGAPFIVDGYTPPVEGLALSGDDGANLAADNDELVETF